MPSQNYPFKSCEGGLQVSATVHWSDEAKKDGSYSIALAFHGGGFVVGSRYMLPEEQIQYLADAGYVVVSADYRLCPQVSLYEGPIEDAKDAYRWCKSHLPELLKEGAGINVDGSRIAVFGHSAGGCLTLHLGSLPDPPSAILDFYGVKYTSDPLWFQPLPALAKIPSLDEAFLNQIYQEPVISHTGLSLEGASKSNDKPKTKGLPMPDLSVPRNAWLFSSLKNGTHFSSIVKDGDYQHVDPVRLHGIHNFSVKAHEELQLLGVETGIELPEGKSHGFDVGVGPEDPDFASIRAGLDFLIRHK
ncbi:uncharacterized protein TRUGW13939_02042 [Talaromyces rugulosus]|uniref:Alpha/beta hydrolase fold-3 domain-containing protein n=1 Tax=Talaromyces rugulosus TaxID=121627 RepID=A0A7H8QMB5_TALRU|nr:uncharacterized protein TRUGW13939_02042 [Talaromyces rugulosus]QKX54952.1 hypothetical protein TRUGW13939_02042 [Talaromyces rugulosus]